MHNTGNPLGSKDILDLYDNSEAIDQYVNSREDSFPDRFGTKRLTLAGLIKRSMALRNEINDFSGALTFRPEWSDVPMNVSEGVGGKGGALNLQAEALGNRSEINKVNSREAIRRSYAEGGYHLVSGSFEVGGVLVNANDVLLYEETGVAYAYSGTLPHTIGAGATPIGNPLWVAKAGVLLRTALGNAYSDDYNADPTGAVDATAALNALFRNLGQKNCTIKPGTYLVNGDLLIKNVGHSFGSGGEVSAYGVKFTGNGRLIFDSVKCIKLSGVSMPTLDIVMRGCWWSKFNLVKFRSLIINDSAGSVFSSNYWNTFTEAVFQRIVHSTTATTASNAFRFNNCTMRGDAQQGFTSVMQYAIEALANKSMQQWRFNNCDLSYYGTDILYVAPTNTADIEMYFNGTYWDTKVIKPLARNATEIKNIDSHNANSINHAITLAASTVSVLDETRSRRGASHPGTYGRNLIENGDLRSRYAGTLTYGGRPTLNYSSIVVTEGGMGPFGAHSLIINNDGSYTNSVRFRTQSGFTTQVTGQYTGVIVLRALPGVAWANPQVSFTGLYAKLPEINDTDWTVVSICSRDLTASGVFHDVVVSGDGAYGFEVAYVGIFLGREAQFPSVDRTSLKFGYAYAGATLTAGQLVTFDIPGVTAGGIAAAVGDFVDVALTTGSTVGVDIRAFVSTASTVRITLSNTSADSVTIPAANILMQIRKL